MAHPTKVTTIHPNSIVLKLAKEDSSSYFLELGFLPDDYYDRVYVYDAAEPQKIFNMIELLRDRGVPFSTNRQIGADEIVASYRSKGLIQGRFSRLRKLGRDWDEDAPYVIENF